MDRAKASFLIVDPLNSQRYLASFERNYVLQTTDYWSVKIFDPDAIDLRILKVFAAFACDTQTQFKRDF